MVVRRGRCELDRRSRHPAIDRGWAWMTVFAAALGFFVIHGITKTGGILIDEVRNYFSASTASSALVLGITSAVALVTTPIAVYAGRRFTIRTVIMVGGVVGCVGISFTSFMFSVEYVAFLFGISYGIGKGVFTSNAFIGISGFFNKRRSLANAIATCGSGLGEFVFPPLLQLLIDTYTVKGAIIILGGIFLNVVISGALFWPSPTDHIDDSKHELESSCTSPNHTRSCSAEHEQNTHLHTSLAGAEHEQYPPHHRASSNNESTSPSHHTRPSSRKHDLDTSQDKRPSSGEQNVNISHDTRHSIGEQDIDTANHTRSSSGEHKQNTPVCKHWNITRDISDQQDMSGRIISPEDYDTRKISSINADTRMTSVPSSNRTKLSPFNSSITTSLPSDTEITPQSPPSDSNIRIDDTHSGKMGINTSFKEQTISIHESKTICSLQCTLARRMYLLIAVYSFLYYSGYTGFVTYVPMSAKSRGIPEYERSALLSISAAFEVAGRLGAGGVGNLNIIQRYKLLIIEGIIAGICIISFIFADSFWWMALSCALYGLFGGAFIGLVATVITDIAGMENFQKAITISSMAMHLGASVAPPLLGLLVDVTQSYSFATSVSAGCIIVGSGVLCGYPVIKRLGDKDCLQQE